MTAYRFRRLNVTASNDSVYLAQEIEFRGSVGGADLTTSATATVDAFGNPGSFSGAEGADKAFNNNTGDWYQPNSPAPVGWDFHPASPQDVVQVRWIAHGSFLGRTPSAFQPQGSDDRVTWINDYAAEAPGTWVSADRVFTLTANSASGSARFSSFTLEVLHVGEAKVRVSSFAIEVLRSVADAAPPPSGRRRSILSS